jgi:hypothetical protein
MTKHSKLNVLVAILLFTITLSAVAAPPKREFYEIKIYHLKSADQEARVENFLKDAYIPAAHRAGIKNVGVFKPVATDTAAAGKLIYVFTPIKSLDQLLSLPKTLDKDAAFKSAGRIISMPTTKLRLTQDLNRSYYRLSQKCRFMKNQSWTVQKANAFTNYAATKGIPKKFTRIR